jgi:hypothetical protein
MPISSPFSDNFFFPSVWIRNFGIKLLLVFTTT